MTSSDDTIWLVPDRLFDGQTMRHDTAVQVRGGSVLQWASKNQLDDKAGNIRRLSGTLAPGLIDIQVNGGGGILLNTSPTRDGLLAIAAAHRKLGCAFTLPTLITDVPEMLDRSTDAMLSLWQQADRGGVAGLHIEGPHISVKKRGTHNPTYIRPLDERTFACVESLRKADIPVLITLAPEASRPGEIARLVAMGAVVSIGHSAASPADMQRVFAEGANCGTHLYNGMTGMAGREPGVAGALINSTAYIGIIADGHHVDGAMIALAWRARPQPGRMILVSDAMPTIGGPDHFTLYGEEIRVVDGKLVNREGSLAGVHMALPEAISRVSGILGDDGSAALAAATSVPAEMLGLHELGHLRPGAKGGLTLFDDELRFKQLIF